MAGKQTETTTKAVTSTYTGGFIPSSGEGSDGSSSALSKHDTASMVAAYPGSPILGASPPDQLNSEKMAEWYQANVLDATVAGSDFGDQSMDYDANGAPDQGSDTTTGAAGLPASGYVPNLSSPEIGTADPSTMGVWSGRDLSTPTSVGDGGAGGTSTTAKDSSAQQSGATLGDYGLGSSPYIRPE